MPVTRLILLLVVLGGLTLLLVQNFSPALPLVFLGARTKPLPLALWILFSTTAGAATTILIFTLLKLINYPAAPIPKTTPTNSQRPPTTPREEPKVDSKSASNQREYSTSNDFDDWETDNNEDSDWEETEQPKTYDRPQTPRSGSQSGSVYSYSYKEPKNTAAGKTESVYDADYRVIIPPYQPPTKTQPEDDDWDFLADDDFGDEDDRT
ncbi:MAG TPA: LapA family protein [Nostocaceae cyanobacterium]|nr:LapA family protein [Nostocaceae cyanobacterium]